MATKPTDAKQAAEERRRPERRTEERRSYVRQPLRCSVLVRPQQGGVEMHGTMSDLSPGGCYVEVLSPLPVGAEVEVVCKDQGLDFTAAGRVATSHPNMGMGIGFQHECEPVRAFVEERARALLNAGGALDAGGAAQPSANAERLLSSLLIWFATRESLNRASFFRMLHEAAEKK